MEIKQALITDVSKDGKPYINKNGEKFYMMHIETDSGWHSSYMPPARAEEVLATSQWKNIVSNKKAYMITAKNGQYSNIQFLWDESNMTGWDLSPKHNTRNGADRGDDAEAVVHSLVGSETVRGVLDYTNGDNDDDGYCMESIIICDNKEVVKVTTHVDF